MNNSPLLHQLLHLVCDLVTHLSQKTCVDQCQAENINKWLGFNFCLQQYEPNQNFIFFAKNSQNIGIFINFFEPSNDFKKLHGRSETRTLASSILKCLRASADFPSTNALSTYEPQLDENVC